jgi:predicted nucleic acid-binding protein
MESIQSNKYQAIVSPVHFQEVNAIENRQERMEILALFERLEVNISFDKRKIRERAEALHALKFGVADAAHVAFAEFYADVFISCDVKLLKQCGKHDILVKAINPVEFSMAEDLR